MTTDKLLSFYAQENALFFQHLQAATVTFQETGQLPPSLFRGKKMNQLDSALRKKKKDPGMKRKPSLYSLFVKQKLKEYKGQGGQNSSKELFVKVAGEWNKLGPEQKEKIKKKFEAELKKDE